MPPKTSSLQRRPRDATETSPASNVGGGQHLSLQQLSAIHESSRRSAKMRHFLLLFVSFWISFAVTCFIFIGNLRLGNVAKWRPTALRTSGQAKSVGKAPKKMTKAEMERENQLANEAWEAIVKSMNEPLPAEAVNVSASNISKEERPRAQDGLVQVDQGSLIGNGASAMDKVLNQSKEDMAKLHKQKKITVSPRGRKLDIWFDHLNPRQDIRSGDTLCLDYRVIGIQGLSKLALKQLTFAIYVNGTAWAEAKNAISEVFAGGMLARQMTIDLPLGTHRLHLEYWRKGGSTGIKSEQHNVTVRRADRGMQGWEHPKDVCMISLLCRTLKEFDEVMRKEDNRYWATYYTLLGLHSWGWFTPWRGVHRYDLGVAGNHERMLSHKTPWKNTINVAMHLEDYTRSVDLSLTRTNRWKASMRGTNESGITVIFTHNLFPTKIEMTIFERADKARNDGAAYWHSSNVEDALGRLYQPSFSLRDIDFASGPLKVPDQTDAYLKGEFGKGWKLLAANLIYERSSVPDALSLNIVADRRSFVHNKTHSQCLQVSTEKAMPEKRKVGWKAAEKLRGVWDVMVCFKEFVDEKPLPGDGVVYIARKHGCPPPRGYMSEGDSDIAKQAYELFGPDELVVEFEGPEILSLEQQHIGRCSYRFPFRITLGGMYFMRITLLRTGWSNLAENDHGYQRPYFDDLLGELKVFIFEGTGFVDEKNDGAMAAIKAIHSGDDLPLCDISKGAVAPGRWVMKPPIKPILPTSTSLGALLDKPKVFCPVCENRKPAYRACGSGKQWITDPRRYAWIPYDCKYPTVTKRQAGSCLGKLRILFSGDSHTRTFYNAFMEQVCDIPSAAQKGHATSQCHEPNATSACSGARMCMEHNYLGWVDATLDPDWWDVIIANFGQHPACGAHHWTQREFRRWFDQYMEVVLMRLEEQHLRNSKLSQESRDRAQQRTRFIWYSSNAMPIARDKMMLASDDWRTNHRLQMYEIYARQRIEQIQRETSFLNPGQILYVDAFTPTYAVQEAAEGDCGHFSSPSYQTPTIEQVLGLIC